ncbi:MAG TPA: response regulator [Candidatus Thermoplasmatota archaeon]
MRRLVVLLVEDSEDDILIVERAFKLLGLGHELHSFATGEEAIASLDAGTVRPDLILLDINLPGLSGFEVLRRIRNNRLVHAVPVTVLSASDRERDVAEAYEAGANSYLVKPIKFEQFTQLLRQWNEYWTGLGRLPASG